MEISTDIVTSRCDINNFYRKKESANLKIYMNNINSFRFRHHSCLIIRFPGLLGTLKEGYYTPVLATLTRWEGDPCHPLS